MRDIRQTPEYAKHLKNIGWTTETFRGVNYFIKNIPLFGSFMKIQRPEVIKPKDIKLLSKKFRVRQIVMEPKNEYQVSSIKYLGFKLSKSPYLPTKTSQIDLTLPKEKILNQMSQKTRYNIKVAQRNKLQITKSKSIDEFVKFWHKCQRKRLLFLSQKKEITSLYKAFNGSCDLLLARHNGTLVAALLVVNCEKISYYMYAASNKTGKKLFAPTLLTWEGISKSKSRGAKVFDFEGIYDERFPIKSWKSFTHFKKSFGGYEVEYPGSYSKFILPANLKLKIPMFPDQL